MQVHASDAGGSRNSRHWFYYILPPVRCRKVTLGVKLQALVYDILPWRKVPESDARSVAATQPTASYLR